MDGIRKVNRTWIVAVAALIIALAALIAVPKAWAADAGSSSSDVSYDTAGNAFVSGDNITLDDNYNLDVLAFGSTITVDAPEIWGDAFLAGQSIEIRDGFYYSSIRTASQNLTISDALVSNNITSCGQTIDIQSGTSAAGIYLAGQNVTFSGGCGALYISADDVTINGIVTGDVHVSATNVTVGPETSIAGTLTIDSSNQPDISSRAEIANTDINITDTEEEENAFSPVADFFVRFLYLAAAFIIIALLICWLAPRAPKDSILMIKGRTGAFIGTGIITLFAAPILLILLFLLFVTIPVAVVMTFAIVIMGIICVPFFAYAICTQLMKRMKPWLVGIISAAIAGLLCAIPVIGVILGILSSAYLAGYLVQKLYLNLKKRRLEKKAAANAQAQATWQQAQAQQPFAPQAFGQPVAGQPVGAQPMGQPTVGQSVGAQPADQPAAGQPGQPTGEQPLAGQPTVGQPGAMQQPGQPFTPQPTPPAQPGQQAPQGPTQTSTFKPKQDGPKTPQPPEQ